MGDVPAEPVPGQGLARRLHRLAGLREPGGDGRLGGRAVELGVERPTLRAAHGLRARVEANRLLAGIKTFRSDDRARSSKLSGVKGADQGRPDVPGQRRAGGEAG